MHTVESAGLVNEKKNFFAISRLCPTDFQRNGVALDVALNMVVVKSREGDVKCPFDECCEFIPPSDEPITFSVQSHVWSKFGKWLNRRSELALSKSCVLAVGPAGSGKSFTLIGNNNFEERGLIPRFLEDVFSDEDSTNVFIQMTMIDNEEIWDLLDPPSSFSASTLLTETSSFGATNMRSRYLQCRSLSTALETVGVGQAAAATLSIQRNRPFGLAAHYITRITVNKNRGFSESDFVDEHGNSESVYTIDFVEVADMECFSSGREEQRQGIELQRLHSRISTRHKSSIVMRDFKLDYPFKSSALSFLLQDSIGTNISCCIVACILGTTEAIASKSNATNLQFVDKMTEYCDGIKYEDNISTEPVPVDFAVRLIAELESVQKAGDKLLADLYDLDTIPNPTIKQQTADPKRRAHKSAELASWLAAMERGLHATRHMDMSAERRATESLKLLAQTEVTSQNDTEKAAIELALRLKLFFFRRKEYFLGCFLREISPPSSSSFAFSESSKPLYEGMPNVIMYGDMGLTDAKAWIRQSGVLIEGFWSAAVPSSAVRAPLSDSSSNYNDVLPYLPKKSKQHIDPEVRLISFTTTSTAVEWGQVKILRGVTLILHRSMQSLVYLGSRQVAAPMISSEEEKLSPFLAYLQSENSDFKWTDSFHTIQFDGDSIENLHCAFEFQMDDGELFLSVTPFPQDLIYDDEPADLSSTQKSNTQGRDDSRLMALVTVNGSSIKEKTRLHDGDILVLGVSTGFSVHIGSSEKAVSIKRTSRDYLHASAFRSLQLAVIEAESERVHNLHVKGVDRFAAAIATREQQQLNPLMTLKELRPSDDIISHLLSQISVGSQIRCLELIIVCRVACYLSITMGRDVRYILKFREKREEDMVGMEGTFYRCEGVHKKDEFAEYFVPGKCYTAEIFCQLDEGNIASSQGPPGASWWWSQQTFIERFYMMLEMYRDFRGPARRSLETIDAMYAAQQDPFVSTPDDELIGVSYLYPDALQYMLDINEQLPIVNFKGYVCGSISVNVRAWIDEIQLSPSYLSADKECKIEDFANRKFIIRLFFESLNNIPARFCCYNRVSFKFFYHLGVYTTPTCAEKSQSPIIGKSIIIEQLITPDFIDYLQRGSIEFEVWGKRPNKITASPTLYTPAWRADEYLGDPPVFDPAEPSLSPELDDASLVSEQTLLIAELRSEIDRLKSALDKKSTEARSLKVELDQVSIKASSTKEAELSSKLSLGGTSPKSGKKAISEEAGDGETAKGSKTCTVQ